MVKQDDLIIPVYLNQRIVFDLVAMLQGGFASVTQVSRTQKESGSVTAEAGTQFGLSKALSSLLKIDISGKVGRNSTSVADETRSEQRIHTPASLFIVLRSLLHDRKYIIHDSSGVIPKPGSIIEFSASLRRNPLLETIGMFVELMGMEKVFTDSPKKGKGSQPSEGQKAIKQMQLFISALEDSDTADLITAPLQCSYRSVITLEKQYLNDPSMSDLVDGTFRVVGKVIRAITEGEEGIKLNRKSAVGRLPSSILSEFKTEFEQTNWAGLSIPEFEWEIPGPVIQVLPIAIFA